MAASLLANYNHRFMVSCNKLPPHIGQELARLANQLLKRGSPTYATLKISRHYVALIWSEHSTFPGSLFLEYLMFWPPLLAQPDSITLVKFRIKLFSAFRTNTMAELSFRMVADISLNLIPVTFVVAYFFAVSANW